MKFKKIKLKNIRSYKDQEIDFPDGSVLLSGDVGAGKTSILMAIEYALFGLQPGQKGTSLLRNDQDLGEVTLSFEIDGLPITIERKLKRTAKGVSNEYSSIIIDDEKFESSVTEIKSKIVALLGYPQEFVKKNNVLYRYTIHSPQEQMKQIILEDPETRLNTLRHIFGMDKYKRIKENLLVLISNLKNESKVIHGEIKDLDQNKKLLEEKKLILLSIEEKIGLAELECIEKTKIRKEKEDQLKETKLKIEERRRFQEEIEKTVILTATKKELILALSNEEREINNLIGEAGQKFDEEHYSEVLQKLKERRELFEKLNLELIDLRGNINSFEKELVSILSKKERIFKIDICPTCLQDVSEVHKHNIMNETEVKMKDIEKNIDIFKEQEKEKKRDIEILNKEIKDVEETKSKIDIFKAKQEMLEVSKTRLKEISAQKKSMERDVNLLNQHINGLKERVLSYSFYQNNLNKIEQELKESFKAEKETEILIAELKKESELSSKEIDFFSNVIREKEKSAERLLRIDSLIDWLFFNFSKIVELIENSVLLNLRGQFSSLFRKWFLMLVPENSLDSQIDENFTPVIIQGEAEMDYDFLSGGERTAVALAYRLALNQTITSFISKMKTKGLIILDEPTDGFSETQVTKIRDILDELNAEQLIIVSHEQKIESFVDNVLKVSKEGDISKVEMV